MDITLESLMKLWGPLGVLVGILWLVIWKKLIPYIEKQNSDNRALLTSALEDARKERDLERQMRERELARYMESMKYRDDQFKPIADAIQQLRPRRERN